MDEGTLELLFRMLECAKPVVDIARAMNPRRWRSRVKKLRKMGIVESDGCAPKPKDGTVLALLRRVERRTVKVMLRGSNERIFLSLATPGTVDEVARRTGLSTSTVYRAMLEMYRVGVACKEGNMIRLEGKFAELANAMNVEGDRAGAKTIHKDSRTTLRAVPAGAACVGQPTAFSAFGMFGIGYRPACDYYAEQRDKVDTYDMLLHALLAARESNDAEATSMALVFYLKNRNDMDVRRICIGASTLGIVPIWRDVESYMRSGTAPGAIPFQPWDEFTEKAKSYGVDAASCRTPSSTESALHDLGNSLKRSVRIYLFGDENMRWKNLKDSVRRCEIMVETSDDLEMIVRIMSKDLGWSVDEIRDDVEYPFAILKHSAMPETCVYTKSVMGDVLLTDSMARMADHITFGKLEVRVLRNEHVFILKTATEYALEDMAALVYGSPMQPRLYDHGSFDWDLVLEEVARQEKAGAYEAWPMHLFEMVSQLESMGVEVPILKLLRRLVTDLEIMGMARSGWCPLDGVVRSFAESFISDTYVRNRVNALIRMGRLEKRHEGRRVIVCGEELFPRPETSADYQGMGSYLWWRFRYRRSEPGEFDKLVRSVKDYGTIGDLDGAVARGVFELPYNPPPSPAESVMMCLRF